MSNMKRLYGWIDEKSVNSPNILNELDNIIQSTNKTINGFFADVRDFGAKGNGINDDGNAFSLAYASIASGGVLFVPAGTYLISSTQITPVSNTRIIGAGQRTTIINWAGSGYWLDDISSGTIKTCFTLQGMTVNVTSASGKGVARIGDPTVTVFSENNQHIEYVFRDILAAGSSSIVTSSGGLQLTTFIRTTIEDCLFFDFDVGWDLKKFDVGYVKHNRIQRFKTYGIQFHNDMTGGGAQVADETVFINNEILEIPATSTAAMFLKQPQNVRFIGTYMEPKSGDSIPIAWSTDSAYNISIIGGTVSKCTQIFNLKDSRNVLIQNVGLQDPEISPAPTSAISYQYNGSTDATGTGGPFNNPKYGLIKVIDCAYLVNNSFKGLPGVTISGTGLYGSGVSQYGGTLPDTSQLYSTQVLDRNGLVGNIKETGIVLSPFSSNTYLNGSAIGSISIVADANATTGYALKSTANNIFMDVVYPGDILKGAYEIVARIRTSASVTNNFFALYYDGAIKENWSGVNTTTSYQIVNAKFDFSPANNPSTLSIRMGDQVKDLYLDYFILRPCFNSVSIQKYVQPDIVLVGTNTTPGYRVIYSNAAPTTGNWSNGDIVFNTAPASAGTIGWVCTTAGAPGTWKTWGAIN